MEAYGNGEMGGTGNNRDLTQSNISDDAWWDDK
jgi:hypothetical protein